jgi:hypothetical protein
MTNEIPGTFNSSESEIRSSKFERADVFGEPPKTARQWRALPRQAGGAAADFSSSFGIFIL